VICASNSFASTTNRGLGVAGLNGGNTQAFAGSGTQTIWGTTTGGVTAVDVPTYRDISWQKSANAWAVRRKGTAEASGTTPNTPSALDSATAMTLGGRAVGTALFVGRIAAFLGFPYVDAGGRALIQEWIATDMGIAS
jgi:hypothetical protein